MGFTALAAPVPMPVSPASPIPHPRSRAPSGRREPKSENQLHSVLKEGAAMDAVPQPAKKIRTPRAGAWSNAKSKHVGCGHGG